MGFRHFSKFFGNMQAGEVYKKIAEIPFHLIISLSPDLLLKQTFEAHNFDFSFDYYHKGKAATQISKPNKEKPLIYNILGQYSETTSLVLCFNDLFDYLSSILGINELDANFRTELEEAQNVFFLGFKYDKWYLKLIMRLLNKDDDVMRQAAFTEVEDKENIINFYTDEFNFVFEDDLTGNEIIDELHKYFAEKNKLRQVRKEAQTLVQNITNITNITDKQINQFSEQLSAMLFGEMPQVLQNIIFDKIDIDENCFSQDVLDILFRKLNVKLVCSIRSDKMSLLNRLKINIPQILSKMFELKALNIEQAKNAMLSPAKTDGNFVSQKIDFAPETQTKIINYLSENKSKQIETFQLQLICQYCENLIITNKQSSELSKNSELSIEVEELGELSTIFSRHYDNLINEIPETQQLTTRKLIEENMIIDGNRVPLPDKVIISKHKIDKELLQKLVNSRLLRSEPNTTGGYSYEISHDTLVEPISAAYKIRSEKEKKEEELRVKNEELRIEREKEKEELRVKNEKLRIERIENEKKRKQQRTIIIIVSVAAVVSIVTGSQNASRSADNSGDA